METENLLIYAALGFAAYLIIKDYNTHTSAQSTAVKFDAMGFRTSLSDIPSDQSSNGSTAAFVYDGDTTYRFRDGDYDKLNIVQKVGLAFHLPASWFLG